MQRNASARWTGDLKNGTGTLAVGSGAFSGPYSFVSRFEGSSDTNPEELLGAAHAACFSMALSLACSTEGHIPTSVETKAAVHLEKVDGKMTITRIDLHTHGVVPGMTAAQFGELAEATKTGCIVSRALSAVPTTLEVGFEA